MPDTSASRVPKSLRTRNHHNWSVMAKTRPSGPSRTHLGRSELHLTAAWSDASLRQRQMGTSGWRKSVEDTAVGPGVDDAFDASCVAHSRGMASELHRVKQDPDHYDAFAQAYARANENGLFNRWYARPAVLNLLGDVAGNRILDAGCGSGPLIADLEQRGASVAGFDASPAMIELARERLGDEADLEVADLTVPLPYDDEAFDDALAVLVLHYLQDWSQPLSELRRVLKPGGRLVVVVNHPIIPPVMYPEVNYFATAPNSEEYDFDGVSATLTIWYRPLSAMSEAFTGAGFAVTAISEPPVSPDTPPELLPQSRFDPTRFIGFIFFLLEAVP